MALAKDIMNPNVESIRREASVAQVVQKMNDSGVSSLIVEPLNERDTYGIVTMRDVVCKLIARGASLEEVPVHQIMTKPLIFALATMQVKHVARLMVNNDISRVPIIDNNKLVGIITFHDILADTGLLESK